MKHLTIDGCTVTVTGLHEERLAKLIRKLEAKPVRRWKVKARHRLANIELEVEGPGMAKVSAVTQALRVWSATPALGHQRHQALPSPRLGRGGAERSLKPGAALAPSFRSEP